MRNALFFWYTKISDVMKNIWIKLVPVLLLLFSLPVLLWNEKGTIGQSVFIEKKKVEENVEKIIQENEDKKLNINKNVDGKFIYLEFESEEKISSYFINTKTGEETDFSYYLKPGKEEEFTNKIIELLYLKYPKFIVDVLITENVEKIFQVKDNELVIYFENAVIEPEITDQLFLKVNYNEIKEYLDFTFLVDANYSNEDGYHYDKNKKTVALTFDDGPSGDKTNRIVEILEQNKAHATFFMVGNKMNSGTSTITNVLAKGNEIGSHSYAHKNMKRQKLNDLLVDEEKTQTIYKNITGQNLIYTRPPYGSINKNVKENLDTIFITWNLDTEDWLHRDKNYIVDYVMENVSDGDIILMHDSYETTVEAVEELLPKLYAAGYQVVSVSELANLKDRTLEKNTIYRCLKEV